MSILTGPMGLDESSGVLKGMELFGVSLIIFGPEPF